MGRKFLYGCLAVLFILSGGKTAVAGAGVLDAGYFNKIFVEVVQKNAPWSATELAVENFSVRPETLAVPAGKLSYVLLDGPSQPTYLGRKGVNLQILVDGKVAGEVRMSGDLQLYGDVVCLKQNLARHAVLSVGDLEVVRRNISSLGPDLISSPQQAIGQRLRSSLRAGGILYSSNLEPPPLVARGDLVTILAESDRFTITVPGEVRGSAAKGEMVKVKNLMSRKEIFARVVSAETVKVEL